MVRQIWEGEIKIKIKTKIKIKRERTEVLDQKLLLLF
jgi:hypothetical protein